MSPVEIEAAMSELALQPFDAEGFPFAFLAAFGNKDTALKRLRSGNNNASDVPGGVLQRNNIHIAVCAAGALGETLKALRISAATTKAKAKFILATDGQTLDAEELAGGETIACAYPDFPNHFGFFLPLAGISTIKEIKDNPIDVRATGRLNKLYVELLREDPDWATDARRVDMNHFMARLVFCFFAEDTDIFNGEGQFTQTVDQIEGVVRGDTVVKRKMLPEPIELHRGPVHNAYPVVGPAANATQGREHQLIPRIPASSRAWVRHIGKGRQQTLAAHFVGHWVC